MMPDFIKTVAQISLCWFIFSAGAATLERQMQKPGEKKAYAIAGIILIAIPVSIICIL